MMGLISMFSQLQTLSAGVNPELKSMLASECRQRALLGIQVMRQAQSYPLAGLGAIIIVMTMLI